MQNRAELHRALPTWMMFVLLSMVFGLCKNHALQAQGKKGKDEPKFAVRSFDDVVRERLSYNTFHFNFPNINKVFSYRSPQQLKKVLELEQQGDLKALLPVLEEYVSNFGIQNFYNETRFIWKLGQLYEANGQTDKAKNMYRLVLKHHKGKERDNLRQYYTKLDEPYDQRYVPLKHYYELVEFRKHIDTLRPPKSVYLNMGEAINSKAQDYAPALNANDDTLIFSSKRNKRRNSRVPNEDLFISVLKYGYWMDCDPLTEVNSEYNEGSAIISRNGKTLIFTRCDSPNGYGSCDLFQAEWDPKKKMWTRITNMGPNINGISWDSQPCLSPTEDTLYFVSDRLGGFGHTDIYFSVKEKKGGWGPAQNLGPVINTAQYEASPYMYRDQNVLYFASTGHLMNFGNFDIYKSYYRNGRFQEPQNIGPLVNGGGNEYYFTIDSKAKNLYYARSEDSTINDLDLFSFPVPMEAQPRATTIFAGQLTDSSGKAFAGIVSVIDLDHNIEVAPKFLREDGSFDFDLINNNNYLLIIQGDEFFRIEEKFFLKGDTFIGKKARSIKNVKLSFPTLEFLEASADILPSMYNDLNNLISFLTDNPNFKLKIAGHTDAKGNKNDNMLLSQNRADAIKEYLTKNGGIRPRRIDAKGFGSTKPIIQNEKTDQDRKINRRVEFELIDDPDVRAPVKE